MKPIKTTKPAVFTAAWYRSGTFRLNSSSVSWSTNRKNTRPPSSAGMGSMFITARFTAISAAK